MLTTVCSANCVLLIASCFRLFWMRMHCLTIHQVKDLGDALHTDHHVTVHQKAL